MFKIRKKKQYMDMCAAAVFIMSMHTLHTFGSQILCISAGTDGDV